MKKVKENLTIKKSTNTNTNTKKVEVPDGGWGWLVVIGCCFNNIFNLSYVITFGMIYGDMIKEMGEGTKGSALVVNVGMLVANCFGPISAVLIKASSCRIVAVLGSLLTAVSVIASGYSTTLWHLIVLFGFFRGIGLCMITTSTFVAMNSYFKKNRGKAIGFSAVGSGIGQSIMPYVVKYFMDEFSFKGTAILTGALCLNGIAGALLLQPVEWHMKTSLNDSHEEEKLFPEKYSLDLNSEKRSNEKENFTLVLKESSVEITKNSLNEQSCKKSRLKLILENFIASMDLTLLRDWRFVVAVVGNALAVASVINFVILTPFVLKDLLKLDGQKTALVLSVLSGSDVVGRIVMPTITDKLKINASSCMLFASLLIAIIRQIMTFEINLTIIIILSILHGLGKTLIVLNQNISVADYCRQDQVPSAVGLYMLVKGIVYLPLGYFAGWIRDYTGDFVLSIALLNSMLIIVVIMYLVSILSSFCIKKSIKDRSDNL